MTFWRLLKAAIVAFALFAATLSGGGLALADHTSGGDLLPDLVTVAPRELEVKFVGGEKRLYFTNEIINQHTGVLEIFTSSNSCNSGSGRIVFQRIFQDANNDGVFQRGVDTSSRATQVGCMVFHAAHNHWHFDDFTHYRLTNLSGGTVSQGSKQSTCVEDTAPRYDLPGQPNTKYFGECTSTKPQGISVGWGDIYRSTLPDQYVSIAGVPNGEYCLFSTANPDRNLSETNQNNNSAAVRLVINGNSVTTSSNTSCPSSNPAPIPPSLSIYDDSLHWDNWSWGTNVNPNNASPVYSGSRSLAVTYNGAWPGLSLHSTGLDTSSSSHLHFAIAMGGRPLSGVEVSLYGPDDIVLGAVDPTEYATGGANDWLSVSIPLEDLGASSALVTRVNIQDNTGSAQPTFYIDELGFLSQSGPGGDPLPPPPSSSAAIYDNSLHWDNWSWSTSVNPGATSPVLSGGNSMAVTYNGGWAGLSLHHDGFSASPYSHLRFAINAGGRSLSSFVVSLYNASDTPINDVNPASYATSAGGGWFNVAIPLSALGATNTTVTRVTIQDDTGGPQPAFHIDNLAFTN